MKLIPPVPSGLSASGGWGGVEELYKRITLRFAEILGKKRHKFEYICKTALSSDKPPRSLPQVIPNQTK